MTETDAAGNTTSTTVPVTIDTTAPALTAVLDPSSDTGVQGDGITSDTTPTISGTGEPGSTISVVIDGQTLTTTVTSGGTWSVTPASDLTDGTYTALVTETDTAGNSLTATVPVVIDTTSPKLTALLDPSSDTGVLGDGITSDTTPTISGTGEPGAAISVVLDGQTLTTTATSGGTWSVTPVTALADGTYTVSVTETDASGNINTTTVPVTIDTTAPAAPTIDPVTDVATTVTGKGDAGATVTVTYPNGSTSTATVQADGTWTTTMPATVDLKGGDKVTATQTDSGNNTSGSATAIVTDTNTAPIATAVPITTPQGKAVSGAVTATDADGDPLTFTKTTDPSYGTVIVNSDGTYTYTPNASYSGPDSFTVTVSDGKGGTNTAIINITVTLVNDPPIATAVPITTPQDKPVSGKVTATDADGDPLTFTKTTDPTYGTVIVNPDGTYTYTPNANYSGPDSFMVTVSDGKGGTSIVTVSVMITIEQIALKFYNGITPNGDGNNDVWWIDGIEGYPDNEVLIFNRWGDKIIELRNYDNTNVFWDGKNRQGKMVPDGTYYYLVKIRNEKTHKGWINLRSGNN